MLFQLDVFNGNLALSSFIDVTTVDLFLFSKSLFLLISFRENIVVKNVRLPWQRVLNQHDGDSMFKATETICDLVGVHN